MNWGYKLLLVFIAFAIGMGYLIYRSMNVNYELVSKDYYKKELRYQEVIDATSQANALSSEVELSQKDSDIFLKLPGEMKNTGVKGDIWFYCAWNEKNDRRLPLHVNKDAVQVISKVLLPPGSYTVKINWSSSNKNYYSEKYFTVL